jgi:kynureninase
VSDPPAPRRDHAPLASGLEPLAPASEAPAVAAGAPPRPEELARHYTRFRVGERLLLTGHSHQAWPDVAFEAQQRAWLDAADHVDDKWERAAAVADRVRAGWTRLLGDPPGCGEIALGPNTHELVTRFLSALPLRLRPRLLTSDGEFHSLRRQLDRLAEEGIAVVKVPARPVGELAGRLAEAVDGRTAAVLVSSVLFETAEIVPGLRAVADACARHGCELLVDAYHHLNVVPFDLTGLGLERAFVTGGGYKYCQMGEGNGFLRFPADCELRPVLTGWFSEFAELADARAPGELRYGRGPARFAGATYDPVSHYRASAVMDFFEARGLGPETLRALSRRQVGRLAEGVAAAVGGRARAVALERVGPDGIGGFLALEVEGAHAVQARLQARGIRTDVRGSLLRLGPAPYVTEAQLDLAVAALAEALA